MDDFLGSFQKSMCVRKKYAKKSCVGWWDHSLIMEADKFDFWGLGRATYGGFCSVEDSNQQEYWVTCHYVKCHSVRAANKSKIWDVIDVAPRGACRPWIFFINGVLCFLKIIVAEWRMKKDDWRRHFKEKMSQEEAHHHRKPWIRAWGKKKMSGGRGREGARNFVPQMRYELWSVIFKWSKLKKCTHMTSIYSLSVTQNWREIWISLEFEIEFVEPKFH